MANKSGGDSFQANQGSQGNASIQGVDSVAAAGAGTVDSLGGSAFSTGVGTQFTNQNQAQGNAASTGDGGNDNVFADTNINV